MHPDPTRPSPGPLLGSGRDADVYACGDGRVLRRYRDGTDVTGEAAAMAHLHRCGFPVPEVFAATGTDLVMERVDGPTLLHDLLDGSTSLTAGAQVLADLHTHLHALPAHTPGAPAETRILHLDLHPDNVIMGARGPVLIDWRNVTEGPPDLDLACTALILGEGVAGSFVPPELAAALPTMLAEFLQRAGGDPLTQLEQAVARRSASPALSPEEKARLGAAADHVQAQRTLPGR